MADYTYDEEDDILEDEEDEEIIQIKQVLLVPTNKLRVHKLSKSIYKERKNSKEVKLLAEDISRRGQLEPIIINADYIILSGVKRYYAALKLGLGEIQAIINDVFDESKAAEIIVSHNITGMTLKNGL